MASEQLHIETAAKLGKLLKDALNDLISVEMMDGYTINMGRWHSYYTADDTCSVCLAGAWLVEHGRMDRKETLDWSKFDRENEQDRNLMALDELRSGSIADAFNTFTGMNPDHEWLELNNLMDREFICYHKKPNKFKRQMSKLARRLTLAGSPDSPGESA